MKTGQLLLMIGGSMSLAGAAVHLATIVGGPDWYRFFGAGEPLARAAERGSPVPALITTAIAVLLLVWAAYAFSGAGLIQLLPLLRTGLVVISIIYLVRGLFLFAPAAFGRADLSPAFIFWSSLIVLVMGLTHAAGTALAWPMLTERSAQATSAKPESP